MIKKDKKEKEEIKDKKQKSSSKKKKEKTTTGIEKFQNSFST